MVSENPFVKFPQARAFLTRPYASESHAHDRPHSSRGSRSGSGGGSEEKDDNDHGDTRSYSSSPHASSANRHAHRNAAATAFSQIVAQRRGHLLPAIPRNVATALDARAAEVTRSQQRHHREDVMGFQRLLRAPGSPPIFWDSSEVDHTLDSSVGASAHGNSSSSRSSSRQDGAGATALVSYMCYADWAYLNPHAVRAETRDALHRGAMTALRQYERASEDLYRESVDEVEVNQTDRPVEQRGGGVATYMPTRVHFTALLRRDPHLSFLLHVALKDESECGAPPESSEAARADDDDARCRVRLSRSALEQLIRQLGNALYATALEYGKEETRRVNRQKVNIAAVLLDQAVQMALHEISLRSSSVPMQEGEEAEGGGRKSERGIV